MANNTRIMMRDEYGNHAMVPIDRMDAMLSRGYTRASIPSLAPATDTTTTEISKAEGLREQPESVGNKGLFLALIALAMRADEGIQGHEVAKTLGLHPTTVNGQLRKMVDAHYFERVQNPTDARKYIHYLTAVPRDWNPEEAEGIIADYKAKVQAHVEEESGDLPLMKKNKTDAPTECAMAKALANTKPILVGSAPAYRDMLDFIIKAPKCTTKELNDIIDEFVGLLQRRIASARHDCPVCRAHGTIENVHNAVHCVKCGINIDGFGSFDENFKALRQLARARRED